MTGLHKAFIATLACSVAILASSSRTIDASNCAGMSVGRTPLDDLGAATYQGRQGGLYPAGVNVRPAAHDLALDRVGRIMLRDAQGLPDPAAGRIVLMSVGMSNTTQEFSTFKPLADAEPTKNSRLVIVDAAQGGQDAAAISNPNAAYWSGVDQKLAAAGVTPAQVQAVWLKEARIQPTEAFPTDATILRDQLRSIVQIIHARYPNTRSVYLSSRTYAGYASTALNPEPYAYQSAFSVKWLIEEQLAGSAALNFDPVRGPVRAPWLSWGPYLWADGLTPRSDGLTWECADFVTTDGTHPSTSGRNKVAGALLSFFKSDPTTVPWFVDCALPDPGSFAFPPEVQSVSVGVSTAGAAEVSWNSLDPVVGEAAVYDVVSGSIPELQADRGFARASCLASRLTDTPVADPQPVPPAGEAFYYLVRGSNSCGTGTYGDSGLTPDPRDLLDSGTPACP